MTEIVNVIHLSDLHFGIESDSSTPTAAAKRKNTLDALIDEIKQLDADWKPQVIVLSGDIGWYGLKTDYDQARMWIEHLLHSTGLTPNELILCAGNHDIDRTKTVGMNPPTTPQEADEWLKVEKLENFLRPFDAFSNFIKECNVPGLQVGGQSFSLIGCREICGLRFVVLNSAWFSRGNKDRGNLWIGLPQLEVLNANRQLADNNRYDEDVVTISVLHHPRSLLNENEHNSYGNRRNTFEYLGEHSHIVLVGHSHSRIEKPERVPSNRAYVFKGGATYEREEYRNNCSILSIDNGTRIVKRLSYEFDPGQGKWQRVVDQKQYNLRAATVRGPEKQSESLYDYKSLRSKIKDFTKRFIDRKSHVIGQYDRLPPLITRKVAVHAKEERIGRANDRKLRLLTAGNLAPFSEMISTERPIFVFGDLGSGKSTLVGQYILESPNLTEDALPLLLPATYFRGREFKSVLDVANEVSRYVNEQIYPSAAQNFDLIDALKTSAEVTLVVDGFDELDLDEAGTLLNRLEELAQQWAELRVIVTGRPVELVGLNYAGWQCLEMHTLTTDEEEQLLLNEALAAGLDYGQARKDAQERLAFLQQNSELLSIATTPLSIRLLRPHLKESAQRRSMGDLLYDVILERLGKWISRDLKEEFKEFRKIFPDELSRERLLGKIAAKLYESGSRSITKHVLRALLDQEIGSNQNRDSIVSQGCDFFIKNILNQEGEAYTISAAPLLQCALGIYIADLLQGKVNQDSTIDMTKIWREYSFSQAVARRRGIIPKVRPNVLADLSHLRGERWLPNLAIIVAESGDSDIAKYFVRSLGGLRPLKYLDDSKSISFSSYAQCFFLAGEEGFNWFFDQYLNPVYPMTHHQGFHIPVFQHWLLLSDFHLTEHQAKSLSSIVIPHTSTRSWQAHALLPSVSLAVPEAFEAKDRPLFFAQCLSSSLTRHRARQLLQDEYNGGNQAPVLNALETICGKDDYGHSTAEAELWLEMSQDRPPFSIVHCVINASTNQKNRELLNKLSLRIGEDKLAHALKWYVLKGGRVATAAAILLYEQGENDLFFLGRALLDGLHDGGKVEGAEEVLDSLIRKSGETGLYWLVNRFPKADSMNDGAHSAYWRILLRELNRADKIYTQLITFAIRYLGEFILPRYPDIRRELHKLLSSKEEYKKALEKALGSLDNVTRYNTACALVSCFPENLASGIEIVIAATRRSFERHEWTRFCMKLSLGKEVQDFIVAKLNDFLPVPRTFALALLHHNSYAFTDSLYRDLIVGLLEELSFDYGAGLRGDDLPRVLAENRAYGVLVDILEANPKLAEKAAGALWEHHRNRLDDIGIVKCLTRVINSMGYWDLIKLDAEYDAIMGHPECMQRIKEYADKIRVEMNREPILATYLRALSDPSAWKDLVWASIFRGDFPDHNQIESACMWLLSKGKIRSTVGEAIGSYADHFLGDPRVIQAKLYNDAPYWLALLAHEFSGLKKERIQDIVLRYRPIGDVASALIARLGYVPKEYKPSDRREYLPIFSRYKRATIESPSTDRLTDITRDAEEIHPEFPVYVEKVLLAGALTEEELRELASKSQFGTMFALFILFCRTLPDNFDLLTRVIGLKLTGNNVQPNATADNIGGALSTIMRVLSGSDTNRLQYIEAIKNRIIIGNHTNVMALFHELLENNVGMSGELFAILVSELVTHPYELDLQMAHSLSDFLVNGLMEEDKATITLEIRKGVRSLSVALDKHESLRDALCCWFFSLSAMYLQNAIDEESEALFLRGLRVAFLQRYEHHYPISSNTSSTRFSLRDVFRSVFPLFERISPTMIHTIILNGTSSKLPETASVCRLLMALVKNEERPIK